uniref:(northern house mosquito) hypothetical protein n=1 Tax=Culex pipiens TaxID=7175 RepID=A0A8D8FA71_CULPI
MGIGLQGRGAHWRNGLRTHRRRVRRQRRVWLRRCGRQRRVWLRRCGRQRWVWLRCFERRRRTLGWVHSVRWFPKIFAGTILKLANHQTFRPRRLRKGFSFKAHGHPHFK